MSDDDKTSSGLGKIHADYTNQPVSATGPAKTISAAVSAVKQTVASPEAEYRRWRKTFDAFAAEVGGEPYVYHSHWNLTCYFYYSCNARNFGTPLTSFLSARFLDQQSFVNAIAPGDDLSKIRHDQYSVLFRVADQKKRGRISWDDFFIFNTLLKRPDADYLIAFKFFDV